MLGQRLQHAQAAQRLGLVVNSVIELGGECSVESRRDEHEAVW